MAELKKKRKKRKFSKFLSIALLIIILIFLTGIFYLNILPIVWEILILIGLTIITILILIFNFSHKKFFRIIGNFLSIIIILLFFIVSFYLYNTLGFLFNFTNGDFTLDKYDVVVLNNSNINELKDLNNKEITYSNTLSSDNINEIKKQIAKKIKVTYSEVDDIENSLNKLINKETNAIILKEGELSLLEENNSENYKQIKSIFQIKMKNNIQNIKDAVNINNEPFNIYLTGIDTYGKITSTSRSDVNILVTVNPKNEKILITWIPRDYYVNINNSTYKDKLTHAGIYGVNSSIYAIEKLLDTHINYYVKVNFTSIIDVVNILGGLNVYNDEDFSTETGYTFRKGNITLNGEEALAFVRERKHVTGGDLGRGKNQIKVLNALIDKAKSKEIIKNYNKILDSLDSKFVTNMSQGTILGFIKKEIQQPRNWQIESNTLTGSDSYEYTYSYKNSKLYVMIPDEKIVKEAREKIKAIFN